MSSKSVAALAAIGGIAYMGYQWLISNKETAEVHETLPEAVPPHDMTLAMLRAYDGKTKPNILLACMGKIYEVTAKRNFYGPGGVYEAFAGRDASRALAKGELEPVLFSDTWDSLEDLTDEERASLDEWHAFFSSRYKEVGTLLRNP